MNNFSNKSALKCADNSDRWSKRDNAEKVIVDRLTKATDSFFGDDSPVHRAIKWLLIIAVLYIIGRLF